ncbi:hypothetical protein [Nocardioides currus]|uniref:Uncharacterized protein n=1 Tax=Nocardioides currus TaxID=2133958 RepID=A0A2R7YWP8_9ACTN|nr:hypothetical protein [Nocardioides currus]PUA80827.1 hypothetical protein C7S10_10465 [Nocardioides currus]
MRLRARLTSTTAIVAALAVLAPMAPASAAPPVVSGQFAAVAATVPTSIRAADCSDAAAVKVTMDLTGVGAALEAAGWYAEDKDPVRTELNWAADVTVTGPNNYYADWSTSESYPASEDSETLTVCPDDFGNSIVTPGSYAVVATYRVYNYKFGGSICHPQEPCNGFENIYTTTATASFALDYSPECYAAKTALARHYVVLKKAKSALKKAKAGHSKARIKRAKKKLRAIKAQTSTAKSNVEGYC